MAHSISAAQLRPGQTIFVQGTIQYARITRLVEGDELVKDQQRRTQNGMFAINHPYLTITLKDPRIVPASHDPANLTREEQYVQESFYQSQKNPGLYYNGVYNTRIMPRFYEKPTDASGAVVPGRLIEVQPQGEPAQHQTVTLMLRTFKPKNYPNLGFNLDGIVAEGKMQYYQSNSALEALKSQGIVVESLSDEDRNKAQLSLQRNNISGENGMDVSNDVTPDAAPAAQPVSAPANTQEAYSSRPVQTPVQPAPMVPPVQQAPVQNPAPAAPAAESDDWTCPACGHVNHGSKFCGNCGAQKPGQVQTGIRFDPNDNRAY